MAKSKSREIEHLRSELRKLRKTVSRSEKRQHLYEKEHEDLQVEMEDFKKSKRLLCPNCDDELELLDLGIKKLLICSGCKYRKVQK